ncbi:HutD family protein [Streptomyces sp. NPDC101393]|uniref:HutD/Ves family protein n=1 Tax=Streptomyces sp. NPDC101393 TaxID=3366141 RepID=UPI0037F7B48B
MATEVLRAARRQAAPWKNGGGVTSEVAAEPAGAGPGDFDWRVSVAEVADSGPFSAFDGVDRIITLVDGDGMVLTVDGVAHTVTDPYVPFAFPGGARTECALVGGPITDFNVMVRGGAVAARVRIARERVEVASKPGVRVLVVALAGSAVLSRSGVELGRLDAVLLSGGDGEAVEVGIDGVLAVVTLTELA